MDVLQPSLKKIVFGFIFTLIIGATIWVTSLSASLAGYPGIPRNAYMLIFAALAGYVLASYFVAHFDKEHLMKMSLTIKILVLYLLVQFARVVLHILKNINSTSYQGFMDSTSYLFGGNYVLYTTLLLTSLVFMVIKHDNKFLVGTVYFVYMLLNPFDVSGELFFSPSSQAPARGMLLILFEGLRYADMRLLLVGVTSGILPLTVLIYMWMKNKKDISPNSEKIFLSVILLAYLLYWLRPVLFMSA